MAVASREVAEAEMRLFHGMIYYIQACQSFILSSHAKSLDKTIVLKKIRLYYINNNYFIEFNPREVTSLPAPEWYQYLT